MLAFIMTLWVVMTTITSIASYIPGKYDWYIPVLSWVIVTFTPVIVIVAIFRFFEMLLQRRH
jgi:hypothetical protein